MKTDLQQLHDLTLEYLQAEDNGLEAVSLLHSLRVKARQIIAILNPDDALTISIKQLIQNSNKLRDIDVFLTQTLLNTPLDAQQTLAPLKQLLTEKRADINYDFKTLLREEWINEDINKVDLSVSEILCLETNLSRHKMEFKEIEKRLRKVVRELKLFELEDKQIHKIRLKVKRLRYQLERFYSDENQALELTQTIQDDLGCFHDYYQALQLIDPHQNFIEDKDYQLLKKNLINKKQTCIQSLLEKLRIINIAWN